MLIKCPECCKEISDMSERCIHCGYPLSDKDRISLNIIPEFDCSMPCPICSNTNYEYDEKTGYISCKQCGCVVKENSQKHTIYIEQQNRLKQNQNIPKCPMCGSTNISKISAMSRATSIIGFGILSKKIGKQWQCNNPKCKHMW